ncbi:MAG TPA: glutathione S-transferase family protein [Gammaproteobacteria bacterium]|nr:glutathione S-transferase family protein [Gammaproteobacteria bacterium]
MLKIYGTPLSTPTNKVRYVANYLGIPYEFHRVNLAAGDQRQPEFQRINPLGKVPAINDDGFTLGESNAIIRYLADKNQSTIYPKVLQERAIVDQWLDYVSQHITIAISKIMYNTYFYQLLNTEKDERSLQDGRHFLTQYLPVIEKQLSLHDNIINKKLTLVDFALVATLDVAELSHVDLTSFPHLKAWQKKMMSESFYTQCHESYTSSFNNIMENMKSKV